MESFIKKNDIEVIKRLLRNQICLPPTNLFTHYSKHLTLEMVKIFTTWEITKVKQKYFDHDCIKILVENNRSDILNSLSNNSCFIETLSKENCNQAFSIAGNNQNFEIIQFLWNKFMFKYGFKKNVIEEVTLNACEKGNHDILLFFLDKGIYHKNLLYYAISSNNIEIVKLITSNYKFNKEDLTLFNFLRACELGNLEIIQLLIDLNPSYINEFYDDDEMPYTIINSLFTACLTENIELFKLLIKNGGKLIVNNSFLHFFIGLDIKIAKFLVEEGHVDLTNKTNLQVLFDYMKIGNYAEEETGKFIVEEFKKVDNSDFDKWIYEFRETKNKKQKTY